MSDTGGEQSRRAGSGRRRKSRWPAPPVPPPARAPRSEAASTRPGAPAPSLRRAVVVPGVLVLVAAVLLGSGWLNVEPERDASPACQAVLESDDLLGLVRRAEDGAAAQLERWRTCDAARGGESTIDAAKDAVRRDLALIVDLGLLFGWAVLAAAERRRWAFAAVTGAILTLAYLVSDVSENVLLIRMLDGADPSSALRWLSAVKLGAAIGVAPLVVIGVLARLSPPDEASAGGKPGDAGAKAPPRGRVARLAELVTVLVVGWWHSVRRFFRRWRRRLRTKPPTATVPGFDVLPTPGGPQGGVGISCSGGGIRSAAFTLGALQAMDAAPPAGSPDPDTRSELGRTRWLAAVSGGSYMAAAWVTGRNDVGDDTPRAWSRLSPEERYLRRHASYLAPGIAGKLWALLRFLLGFVANAGMVVLAAGVLFTPVGWIIDSATEPRPSGGGSLALAAGGCVQLPDASAVVLAPGALVRTSDEDIEVGAGPAEPPGDDDEGSATATVEGAGGVAIAVGPRGSDVAPAGAEDETSDDAPCGPTADAPVPPDELPAFTPGRRLEDGTAVPVAISRPLEVESRGVPACVDDRADADAPAAACSRQDAVVMALPTGSRLFAARIAELTIERDAIVLSNGRLARACGTAPCERLDAAPSVVFVVAVPAALAIAFGLAMVAVRLDDAPAAQVARLVRWSASIAALLFVALVALPRAVVSLQHTRSWLEERAQVASGVGTATLLVALLAQLSAAGGAADAPAAKATALVKRIGGRLRPLLLKFAGVVVGPLLTLGLVLAFAVQGAATGFEPKQLVWWIPVLAALLFLGSGGDLNEWSLHPFYRERLRSAFAVNPRVASPLAELPPPRSDPLDELDDVEPHLVICAAANIADDRVTAPGRPVVSWTFTREAIGSSAISAATMPPLPDPADPNAPMWRPTGTYPPAEMPSRFRHLASTWAAVAVSGAAFSPAMGKMSRPERFVMALGNLRLGLWYPNPRYVVDQTATSADFDRSWYRTHHPRPWYLVKEAIGLHRMRDPWVYVTDGGHYENLGLVELLRRRCTEIYCFDAAGDATDTFGTLADAMRIAREEMDIEIDIRPTAMAPEEDDAGISRLGVWAGVVRYRDPDAEAWLVVAKLTVPRRAPFDIVDLARTLPSFPTHPTADQLYTDQKFEAYRALGHYLGSEARVVGTAIREQRYEDGMSVTEAVAAVDAALCAQADPTAWSG